MQAFLHAVEQGAPLRGFQIEDADIMRRAAVALVRHLFRAGMAVPDEDYELHHYRQYQVVYERWRDFESANLTRSAVVTPWDVLHHFMELSQLPARKLDIINAIILRAIAAAAVCDFASPFSPGGVSPLLFAVKHCGRETVWVMLLRCRGAVFGPGEGLF